MKRFVVILLALLGLAALPAASLANGVRGRARVVVVNRGGLVGRAAGFGVRAVDAFRFNRNFAFRNRFFYQPVVVGSAFSYGVGGCGSVGAGYGLGVNRFFFNREFGFFWGQFGY